MDTDDTIRDDLIRLGLGGRRPEIDVDDAWAAFQRRRSRNQRGRRMVTALGVLVVVLAVGGAVAVTGFSGNDKPASVDIGPAAGGKQPPTEPDSWRTLPPGPLSPRSGASAVWTATEMVIAGGTDAPRCDDEDMAGDAACVYVDARLRDGAAYNPSTDSWRRIAPAPIPFESASAVWTGEVMLVPTREVPDSNPPLPHSEPLLLAYDPTKDVWQERTPPPEGAGWRPVWTGELAIFARSDGSSEAADWTYDPSNDEWTPLPKDPLGCSSDRQMVATQQVLVLFAGDCSESRPMLTRAAVFDPATRQWRRLPGPEIARYGPWIAAGHLVVSPATGFADGPDGPVPFGGVLDLATETWDELPQPSAEQSPEVGLEYFGSAGSWVALFGRLYSPGTGAWHLIPKGPNDPKGPFDAGGTATVWTGQEIIEWGGTYASDHLATGAAYTPPAT